MCEYKGKFSKTGGAKMLASVSQAGHFMIEEKIILCCCC